ncbi:MAG: prepilin-type N-terminal cleavage/methylation domain-containing protein [Sedimentisphaerales bacterium]|nr:prepilin-type N-terminal cleavage/methylation domain-containing protein [Sedimentisphaerales bacterium]
MKSIVKQSSRKKAFTIIELLTVMSIIVILIGVLVPALNKVRRFATEVKQKAQFNSIQAAVELFNSKQDGYPPSTALDGTGQPYCGAMKLCEAMMGRDLLGFHPDSVFRADGMDSTGTRQIYPVPPTTNNVSARLGTLLQYDNANAYRLVDIYGSGNTAPFNENIFVLCDVYTRNMRTGNKMGMPILYYKADTSNYLHDPNQVVSSTDSGGNIYNFYDNAPLVSLGKPWEQAGGTSSPHSIANPARFYRNTRNTQVTTVRRPYRTDSYILISAGFDGEYGTADDICNFEWKYRE